jgi:hypothetical protein
MLAFGGLCLLALLPYCASSCGLTIFACRSGAAKLMVSLVMWDYNQAQPEQKDWPFIQFNFPIFSLSNCLQLSRHENKFLG